MPNAVSAAPMIQGIQAPNFVVDPQKFYAGTRRMRFQAKGASAIQGLGSTESVQLNQTGILSGIELRVWGTIVIGGTLGSPVMSYEWPYNLIQALKLSANGQSNLINARGLTLRAYEFIMNPKLDDNGLSQTFGSGTVSNGTLSLPTDIWGTDGSSHVLAPGAPITTLGTYTFDLTFFVPVAADPVYLIGSVFAQSTATNLSLDITWATQAQLESTASTATFTPNINWQATQVAYSIPNVGGQYVVPDLSTFHQLTDFRQGGLTSGQNMVPLPGVGTGRQLLRTAFQVYQGSPTAPLAMNATNYAQLDWAFGGSDTPEVYPNGTVLAAENVRVAGVNLGTWGFGLHDFASMFAARDSVDEGATSNLRLEFNLNSAPTSAYCVASQETLFAAPVGA